MIPYDPQKPLISLHIPKCGGQSFRYLLKGWFGDGFCIHYFQQYNALPPVHSLRPGMCVHGHFERNKKFGVLDYYPGVDQFITIMRDPLEMAISNYFFWKRRARAMQIELGIIQEGGEHDYRDIDDFFRKRPQSHLLNFLPQPLYQDNFKDYLENHFIWIGLVENLEQSVPVLAQRLGFAATPMDHINSSPRYETLSPDLEAAFMDRNQFEFSIYRYIQEKWRNKI